MFYMNNNKLPFLLVTSVLLSGACCLNKQSLIYENNYIRPVVCLGDSITSGYNISGDEKDNSDLAYPAIIQKWVNIPVINMGVSGDTTRDALYRLNRDVISKNPRIVIIFLGINDIFNDYDYWFTENNFNIIVSNLTEEDRKIYIVKFLPDDVIRWNLEQRGKNPEEQDYIIDLYNKLFQNLQENFYIEIIENIWDNIWQVHTPDGLHPDSKGHKIMGERIYKIIKPYLKKIKINRRGS